MAKFLCTVYKIEYFFLDNGTHAYTESIYANSFRWINSMSWRLLLCCVYESNLLTLVGYLTRVPFIIIWCFAFIKVHKYISNFRNWKWAINTRRQQINSNLSPECIVDYKRDFFPHFIDAFFLLLLLLIERIHQNRHGENEEKMRFHKPHTSIRTVIILSQWAWKRGLSSQ